MTLSQAEIDAMLADAGAGLTAVEIDTLGEVGNMCMGAAATTMYTLLDRRVEITTPRVALYTTSGVLSLYQVPFVVVEVEYTEGIHGKNLLLLEERDAALITDLLMGGEGEVSEPVELTELHISAINEIMNQMVGASATSLSQLIGGPVNISTPTTRRMSLQSDPDGVLESMDQVIVITFHMEIEGLLSSQLIQLMPYEQGRALAKTLTSEQEAQAAPPPMSVPGGHATAQAPGTGGRPGGLVDVRPMQFEAFDEADHRQQTRQPNHLGMVSNIPLMVSVELGKAEKAIDEILDFDMGSIVVLDKTAGDPVEVLVNGKLVAIGEVVVIDEHYGVRITEIVSG